MGIWSVGYTEFNPLLASTIVRFNHWLSMPSSLSRFVL